VVQEGQGDQQDQVDHRRQRGLEDPLDLWDQVDLLRHPCHYRQGDQEDLEDQHRQHRLVHRASLVDFELEHQHRQDRRPFREDQLGQVDQEDLVDQVVSRFRVVLEDLHHLGHRVHQEDRVDQVVLVGMVCKVAV